MSRREDLPPMWTISELATYWRVGQSTLRKWIDAGRLDHINLAAPDAKNKCIRVTDSERTRFEKEDEV